MLKNILRIIIKWYRRRGFENISPSANIQRDVKVYNKENLYMGHQTNINTGAVIMNTRAKFVMGDYSGAAFGLTVITGNHMSVIGKNHKQVTDKDKERLGSKSEFDKDIIVEEDVWIGARATLLFGTMVKRGAIIGAGAVVRSTIPPYAIAVGNPAKVIGFRFTPQEIIEHEKTAYSEDKRLSIAELERNYRKYFLNRISEITKYIKI